MLMVTMPILLFPQTSIEECFYEIQKAFNLAEMYQCPVIFMPDLQQGLNKQSVPSFDLNRVPIERGKLMKEEDLPALERPHYFKRFELTEDGISPRTIPGMKNGMFIRPPVLNIMKKVNLLKLRLCTLARLTNACVN